MTAVQEQVIAFATHCEQQVGKRICIQSALSLNGKSFDRHFALTTRFNFTLTNFAIRFSGAKLMFMGENADYEMDLMSVHEFSQSGDEFHFLEKFAPEITRKTIIRFEVH